MRQLAVKIGPEFFSKEKSDYRDWRSAWVREAGQNSTDAGADRIEMTTTVDNSQTVVEFTDNGSGMTEDVVVDKLFALGSSGKNFNGTTGGFGKAKVILLLCHASYELWTNDVHVTGSGADYTLTKTEQPFHGTKLRVTMNGAEKERLDNAFAKFFALSNWKGTAVLNGTVISDRLHKGAYRKDLGWAKVHTNKQGEHTMVVRIGEHDIPMFTRPVSFKGMVVVTLQGKSSDFLTSNRDGLLYEFANQLDQFITEIAVNTKSAFRQKTIKRSRYDGYRLAGWAKAELPVAKEETTTAPEERQQQTVAALVKDFGGKTSSSELVESATQIVQNAANMEFHIKSETDLEVPAYYTPENFSDYARVLVERWASILMEIALITNYTKPFSVGFCFCDDRVAEHDDGVLLINPATIKENKVGNRYLARAWAFTNESNWDLVSVAAHEWVHFMGHHDHSEDYSSALTELMGKLLMHRSRLGKVFCGQGLVKWNKPQ